MTAARLARLALAYLVLLAAMVALLWLILVEIPISAGMP
jgi:hypothetical protein